MLFRSSIKPLTKLNKVTRCHGAVVIEIKRKIDAVKELAVKSSKNIVTKNIANKNAGAGPAR